MESTLDFAKIADDLGLEVIETTTGMNGYPQDIKSAIIGFANFEDAEKLSKEYGLSIESFEKKDGWQLWSRNNNVMYAPYENSSDDYGDNYSEIPKMDEEDFIESEVKWFFEEDVKSFDQIGAFIEMKKEIWDEVDSMDDDESVITYEGRYSETIKKKSMSFYHDTKRYVIGLI